jgi:hypothetical protein
LQLLDSEQLEFAFQLHGITLEAQARRFYSDVWQTIQDAEKSSDASGITAHERHLRHLCQSYFALVKDWRIEEEERHELSVACASSRDNARESLGILPLFEKQFFRYALCYMELNRALIRARVKISHFAKDHNIEEYGKGMEVNHGTGVMLSRAHREAAELKAKRQRLDGMKALLQPTDPLMEELGAELPRLFHSEGDRQLTLFKGALRRCEFERADSIVGTWKNDHLRATGRLIVAAIRLHAPQLKVHEGIVLHSGELSLPSSILKGDENKVHDFLEKHNVPYMVFQYRALLHLGYLLGRIGSIEGLIIQHAKLASLSARPQADPDYAKTQQQAVLLPARALIERSFPTLGAIFNDMETTLGVLEKLISQTRDYTLHKDA